MRKSIESPDVVREKIIHFIKNNFMRNSSDQLTYEYPLLVEGVIDSLSMMTTILFLEKQFKLDFSVIDIKRDDFTNVNTICNLVCSNLKANEL